MTDNDFYKKIKDNWQDILLVLKDLYELPEVSYKTWLLPLRPDSFRDGTLSVVYPGDRLGLGYIERKYKYCLIKSIETVCAETLLWYCRTRICLPELLWKIYATADLMLLTRK